MLLLQLPKLEAYHEVRLRSAEATWTPERAYQITYLLTDDEIKAEIASNEVLFATTKLE